METVSLITSLAYMDNPLRGQNFASATLSIGFSHFAVDVCLMWEVLLSFRKFTRLFQSQSGASSVLVQFLLSEDKFGMYSVS